MPVNPIGYPTAPLVGGNSVRNPILDGYIFQAGINKPEHSAFLTEKFGNKYTLTTLLDKIGPAKPVYAKAFSWSILDRTRQSAIISSGDSTGATVDLTLDTVATGANLGYFLVDDILRTDTGVLIKVTAVSAGGGFQIITVARVDGTNIVAADFANAESLGHVTTAFDEGSNGPNGRLFLPVEDYNYTLN